MNGKTTHVSVYILETRLFLLLTAGFTQAWAMWAGDQKKPQGMATVRWKLSADWAGVTWRALSFPSRERPGICYVCLCKLMPSSSSKWPPRALTKGTAGWSTQTPVANTQLEDLERHHASPHLAEDIKQSPLLTGMCLVSAWKPEGINSICWISVLYQEITEGQ